MQQAEDIILFYFISHYAQLAFRDVNVVSCCSGYSLHEPINPSSSDVVNLTLCRRGIWPKLLLQAHLHVTAALDQLFKAGYLACMRLSLYLGVIEIGRIATPMCGVVWLQPQQYHKYVDMLMTNSAEESMHRFCFMQVVLAPKWVIMEWSVPGGGVSTYIPFWFHKMVQDCFAGHIYNMVSL